VVLDASNVFKYTTKTVTSQFKEKAKYKLEKHTAMETIII
jgi:hypothetical protein